MLPLVLVIDDSIFYLESWKLLKTARVLTFVSPKEFWQVFAAQKSELLQCLCIVCDYYLGDQKENDAVSFARNLKAKGFHQPIFLATESIGSTPAPGLEVFTAKISKHYETAWQEICSILQK